MKKGKQAAPAAEILSFPQVSQIDSKLLETVLKHRWEGGALFDSETRLIFCNQRYTEMYGLLSEFARPGRYLRDLLIQRIQTGTFVEDPDDYIVRLKGGIVGGASSTYTTQLADGRTFSVVNKPLDGGGWLATHEDITERQRSEGRIAHMARHDALTDLPNRVLLRETLEHELKRVKRGECLAVLCLDLDQFKGVNDALGHPIGDELLKLVADRLRGCTREPDTIARLGGDEFAIIMTQMQQPSDAAALSRRIRDSVNRPYQVDGHQIVPDIRIGISLAT